MIAFSSNSSHAVASRYQQQLSNSRDASFQNQLGSRDDCFPDEFGGHFQSQFIHHGKVQQQLFEQQLHASHSRDQQQLSNSRDASFQDQLGSQGDSFPDQFGSQDIYFQNQITHQGRVQQQFQQQQYNTGPKNQLYASHEYYQQQPYSSQVANNSSQGTFTPIDNS